MRGSELPERAPSRPYRRDAFAIGLAVGVYAVTFGVLAAAAGASLLQAMALSMLTFTGASQIALVGVIAAGGSPASALGSGLLLAARNAIYGLALAPRLPGSRWRRMLAAHLVIDESAAMALAYDEPEHTAGAFWATGVSVFVFWNAGTIIGVLFGQAIGDPEALGLDVTFPAAFLALLGPRLRTREGALAAVAGGVIALATYPITPPGVPVLLAALGAMAAFVVSKGRA